MNGKEIMKKKETIERAEKSFLKEDKAEPFIDRAYVKETKRIFGLLKEDNGDFEDVTDRAIYDIVSDIFRGIGK